MTELLSCPFCGGDVSFHKDEECPGCHLIQCGQCRAFFDFATGADPGNDCASVDALRAAIAPMWNTRAQLAAIQGGMGEEVVVLATVSMGGVEYGIGGAELGDIDIQPDMKTLCALQQSLVTGEDDAYVELIDKAQHQRITAAMAAEVERVRKDEKTMCDALNRLENPEVVFINMKRGIIAKPSLRSIVELYAGEVLNGEDALQAEILRLRAELAEVKGREAVAWIVPDFGFLFPTEDAAQRYLRNINDLRKPTALYATPQPGPDVRGLVEALNFACKSLCHVTSSDGSGHADIALSVLRMAGVDGDERERLVDGWKASCQWRIDKAHRQAQRQ